MTKNLSNNKSNKINFQILIYNQELEVQKAKNVNKIDQLNV